MSPLNPEKPPAQRAISLALIHIYEARLGTAQRQGLCETAVHPGKQDPKQVVDALTGGRGADGVIEAAGSKESFQMAWDIARPNATVAVIAMYEEDVYKRQQYPYG